MPHVHVRCAHASTAGMCHEPATCSAYGCNVCPLVCHVHGTICTPSLSSCCATSPKMPLAGGACCTLTCGSALAASSAPLQSCLLAVWPHLQSWAAATAVLAGLLQHDCMALLLHGSTCMLAVEVQASITDPQCAPVGAQAPGLSDPRYCVTRSQAARAARLLPGTGTGQHVV